MKAQKDCILFFDGYCNLCNGLVDFLIQRDQKKLIHFAPLSGSTAEDLLSTELRKKVDSVILYYQGRLYLRSTAAIWTLSLLGGAWKLILVLFIFPAFMRDPIYKLIARNRYRWFGKKEHCRIPNEDEKERFLD